MEALQFYDVKNKEKFKADKYEIRTKNVRGKHRYFAVCNSPNGTWECWRVVKSDLGKKILGLKTTNQQNDIVVPDEDF